MVSPEFSVAGWGRENLGKKILTHNCLWYVPTYPLPGFSGSLACSVYLLMRCQFIWEPFTEDAFPWGPAGLAMATTSAPPLGTKLGPIETFWWIWASFPSSVSQCFLVTCPSWSPRIEQLKFPSPLGLPMLAGHNWEENILPCLPLLQKILSFASHFLHHFLSFFFSKQLQKRWFWIPAFAFKTRRGKKSSIKTWRFWSWESSKLPWLHRLSLCPGIHFSRLLEQKGVSLTFHHRQQCHLMAETSTPRRLIRIHPFIFLLGVFRQFGPFIYLSPFSVFGAFIFPERECLNASHSNLWK